MYHEIGIGLVLLSGILGFVAPKFLPKGSQVQATLNCFSGGLFLSLSLVHILAHCAHKLGEFEHDIGIHISYLACGLGVLITFWLERKSHNGHDHDSHNHEGHDSHNHDGHDHSEAFLEILNSKNVGAFLVLSFHATMAGLSLGIDLSIGSLIAIIIHKTLEAIALGNVFIKADRKTFWLVCGLFSIMTPLGMILGSIIEVFVSSLWITVIEAFASGTFCFIALFEIILSEVEKKDISNNHAFLAVFFGFILMSLVEM